MIKDNCKKTISMLLAVLMVFTMLPVTAIAEEIEDLGCTHHLFHTEECGYAEAVPEVPCGHICTEECGEACAHEHDAECGYAEAIPGAECTFHCEKCEADVLYSDETFYIIAESGIFAEESGMNEFVLSREDGNRKVSATVLVYDYSANYGKDYVLYVNGEAVQKIEGSKSIYDVFAESGENSDAKALDVVATVGQIYEDEIVEDMKASDMFAELDALGVCAVRIPVTFEEGQTEITITAEVIDDDESEYEESFMLAVLDEKGEIVETSQAILAIADNEEAPEVKISFNCEAKLALNENGVAIIAFKREGNLAINSLAVLFHDGNPLGYVDFAPYQTEQTVEAAYTGVYMLGDENGNITDMTEVIVYDPTVDTYSVPEGSDPVLDAIPDSYATVPDIIVGTPSWFPEWAKNTQFVQNETQKIFMGIANKENSYWEAYSNSSKGSISWFPNGDNNIGVNTSGNGSHVSSGTNKVRTKWMYDLTGIATVEVVGSLSGVDKNAKIGLEVDNCSSWSKTVTSGGTYTMTSTVPLGYRGASYIYVYNRDPQSTGGGTNFYITNGFLANKRQYNIEVRDDLSPNLSYYGAANTHPSVDGNNDLIKIYPADNNESYNKVNIIFNADSSYPAKLVGYKLYSGKTKNTSGIINLNGSNGFYLTMDYLKKYEQDWMWSGDVNGDGVSDAVFSVIPVYEKIGVKYEIKAAKGGSVVLKNPNSNLYMGDYAVFENSSGSELKLTGVYYEAYTDLSSDIAHSATVYADSDGLVRIKLNNLYTRYVFKGVYSADANNLSVYYAEDNPKGEIEGGEGIKVSPANYVKNDYVTLAAKANDNYVTKWMVDTDVYYGDVLYYQLNGNPDYNKIMVSFVPAAEAGLKTANINGIINSSYVNLFTRENTPSPLANAQITVTAGGTFTETTNANGNYTINNFKGVPKGKYTALVAYEGGFAYTSFIFDDNSSYIISVPQFTLGDCYPIGVTASLSGGDSSVNMIPLETASTVNIRVTVQGAEGSKPTKINLHFYDTVNNTGCVLEKSIEEVSETIGAVTYWDIKIPTEDISPNTRLFIDVESEKTIILRDPEGKLSGSETYTAISALADSGYEFSLDYEDTTIPVQYDIPETPSVTELRDVFGEKLQIPILGGADFRISSNTGGFFVTRTDPDTGCVYMMCGYSFEGLYAKGSLSDKYKGAKKSYSESTVIRGKQTGTNDANVVPLDVNEEAAGEENPTQAAKQSNWTFAPAFMFKMTAKQGATDPETYFVSAYETIIGFDLWYFKNFPFTFYGFPLYVSVSFGLEAVFEMAVNMKEDSVELGSSKIKEIFNNLKDYPDSGDIRTAEGVFGASKLDIGVKGGAGFNSFLDVFISATVHSPILFQVSPQFEVGGNLGFDVGAGADIVFFSGAFSLSLADIYYGDNEDDDDNGDGVVDENDYDVIGELNTILGEANARSSSVNNAEVAESVDDFDFETELNNMTFSLMSRSGGTTLRSISDPTVISEDNFKNSKIHLWELGNGKTVAAYLKDNGNEGLNYLSAVYTVSDDGGKTWSEERYFSDNTAKEGSSLQYDINIFELEDRMLVTWSEADFDKLISEMNIDPNELTATDVAKFMGAMNLRGIFIDKNDGSIISEPFTIAENSTVACGIIDAVQNGENVYVYYQRNAIPEDKELTFTELISLDHTIALARANVNDSQNWISTPVRVENENGQQYRIAGVEPFSYNGIVGEVIAVDRDGKLAVPLADGSWVNSDDDRMLILRTYTFNEETGAPETAALTSLTDASTCSQNPQVVSDDENIYLFFNQDGNIAYMENFVANESASEEIKEYYAFAVRNADGSFSVINHTDAAGRQIASHGSIHYGTKFNVSMDDNGSILLCWIADEQKEGVLLATEEIYGILLKDVTNGEAFELMGISDELDEEEKSERQLWAVGKPVAITDENGLIGALDSLCTDGETGEFLLGYTKLNSDTRINATASDIKVVSGTNEPDIIIESLEYERYPMPGTELSVLVTVANNGFKPVYGVDITAEGKTLGTSMSDNYTVWPGTSRTYKLVLDIPEDFDESETVGINVAGKGNQSVYRDSADAEILYGAYFTVNDVWQTSIPGTKDVNVKVTVTNEGNDAGIPEFYAYNSIFGTEDERKTYEFKGIDEVLPGNVAVVEYVLEDTYINQEQTAQINVHTGEGSDQFIQEFMPKPAIVVEPETNSNDSNKPGSTHEHSWSEWENLNGVKSRRCSVCGLVERVYVANTRKTDDEANPETGAAVIIFEKSNFVFTESNIGSKKKYRR